MICYTHRTYLLILSGGLAAKGLGVTFEATFFSLLLALVFGSPRSVRTYSKRISTSKPTSMSQMVLRDTPGRHNKPVLLAASRRDASHRAMALQQGELICIFDLSRARELRDLRVSTGVQALTHRCDQLGYGLRATAQTLQQSRCHRAGPFVGRRTHTESICRRLGIFAAREHGDACW